MLASYTTLKSSPCVKCKRLMDPSAQFPTVRTRLRTKTTDSKYVYQWQAFHKGCIWVALSVGIAVTILIHQRKKQPSVQLIYLCHLSFCKPRRIILYISRCFQVQKGCEDMYTGGAGDCSQLDARPRPLTMAADVLQPDPFPWGTGGTRIKKKMSRIRHEQFLSQSFRPWLCHCVRKDWPFWVVSSNWCARTIKRGPGVSSMTRGPCREAAYRGTQSYIQQG